MRVQVKATQLDVIVDGRIVGSVIDCGDCWRGTVIGRRKRRLYNQDFDTRAQAVRAVVTAVSP